MKNIIIIINLFLISTVFAQTVYEDAEDGLTSRWSIYDDDPTGATISNIYDSDRGSRVIEFNGSTIDNGMVYGDDPNNFTFISNTTEFGGVWSMKTNSNFIVYFYINTTVGPYYLLYDESSVGFQWLSGNEILYGLGASSSDGTWHTFERDLAVDFANIVPGETITEVYTILFRIDGRVDDIELTNNLSSALTVRDNFSTVSYSNNDGTVNWATDWIEVDGEGLGPSTGNVLITSNQLYFDDTPDTGGEPGVEREADLTSGIGGTVTFTFDYEGGSGLDLDDIFTISVSSDGGTNYTTLEDFSSSGATTGSKSYDISAYASSNTRISFNVTALTGGGDEYFLIDNVQIEYEDLSSAVTISKSIATGSDDAEEEGPTGGSPFIMYLDSSDLEIVTDHDSDKGEQKIGLRFTDMTIPVGATITNAYLTFHCISADPGMTNSEVTNLNIQAEDIANAPAFSTSDSDISNRTRTTASTSWAPGSWTDNLDYDSPSIVDVIQEVVDQGSWASGNAIAIIITGTGHRAAQSYDSSPSEAIKLIVTYEESVLPVELTNFSVNLYDNTPTLNWATETETNNIGFEVERKIENTEWNNIGFVKGYGHSNSPKYYSFIDENINSNSNYSYRLKQIDNDGSYEYSKIVELVQFVPSNFSLSQNYPNPFNPTTNISFSIPVVDAKFASTTLKVYDILGSEVAEIVNDKLEAGNYNYEFNASLLSNGVYFYTLRTSEFVQTKKMLLLK